MSAAYNRNSMQELPNKNLLSLKKLQLEVVQGNISTVSLVVPSHFFFSALPASVSGALNLIVSLWPQDVTLPLSSSEPSDQNTEQGSDKKKEEAALLGKENFSRNHPRHLLSFPWSELCHITTSSCKNASF